MNARISSSEPIKVVGFPVEQPGKVLFDPTSDKTREISSYAETVIAAKESHLEKSLKNKWGRYNPFNGDDTVQIGHDVVNMLFVGFTLAKLAKPSLAHIPAIMTASAVCGYVGGTYNILVGAVIGKNAIQALHDKKYKQGLRFLIMAVALFAIGAFMILSTAAAHTTVGAFIVSHPWILPILMVLLMLPLMQEVGSKVNTIWMKKDPFSILQLDKVEELLLKNEKKWANQILQQWKGTQLNYDEIDSAQKLRDRVEQMQEEVGPHGAIAAFKLFQAVVTEDNEKAKTSLAELKKRARQWKISIYARLIQQILYAGSLGVSLAPLQAASLIENIIILSGMGIPASLDIFSPFLRNGALVVPRVNDDELTEAETKAKEVSSNVLAS